MIRRPLALASMTTLIALVIAGLAAGVRGVAGAALGGLVICLSFWVTFWLRDRTAALAPEAVMSVAVGSYAVKVTVSGVLLVVLRNVTWLDPNSFACTAIAATIAWMTGVLWESSRHRTGIYDDAR